MNIIDRSLVVFDPVSIVDPFGKVFHYKDEVFRAINPESIAVCNAILDKAENWERFGLVKTRKSPAFL